METAVTYAYAKTKADARSNHRPAHNTWLADLAERNIVQCSGPFASGNGGLLIFKSDSIENLNALLLEDPVAQQNLIENTSIEQAPSSRHHRLPYQPLIPSPLGRNQIKSTVKRLTSRERDVLTLLGEGLSNGQIARRLHLVEGTVKAHVSATLVQLHADNRVQAAIVAHQAGLA